MTATLYKTGVDEPGEPLADVHLEGSSDGYANLFMGRYYLELSPSAQVALRDELMEMIRA